MDDGEGSFFSRRREGGGGKCIIIRLSCIGEEIYLVRGGGRGSNFGTVPALQGEDLSSVSSPFCESPKVEKSHFASILSLERENVYASSLKRLVVTALKNPFIHPPPLKKNEKEKEVCLSVHLALQREALSSSFSSS